MTTTTLPDETPELAAAVPAHLLAGLRAYASERRPVGGFLTAVLENDLFNAVARADHECIGRLREITQYVYGAMPRNCWGSPDKVQAWLRDGRIQQGLESR